MKTYVQHTPEPWTVEEDSGSFLIVDQDGMKIAGTFGFSAPDREGQEEANARLIAASPKLLEALNRLAEEAGRVLDEFLDHGGMEDPDLRKAYEHAFDVLKEATQP